MKKVMPLLMTAIATLVLAGCSTTNQASADSGRMRTAYTAPSVVTPASPLENAWAVLPPTP